MCEAEIENKVC